MKEINLLGIKARCKYCNKDFVKKSWNMLFCSKECCRKFYKERYKKLSEGIIKRTNGKFENVLGLRFKVFMRDNFICQYCGRNVKEDKTKLHVDHINPRKKGGLFVINNLITSCKECNLGKRDVLLQIRNKR